MKIFIGWSGDRSRALAQAIHDWIPLVLHYAQPFLSEADIEAGKRWGDAIAKELETASFGIVCLTRENLGSPWVLFEAGALAKSMPDSRVVPLLLDLEFKEVTGPLAQFQAKKVDKAGIGEVVYSINQHMTNSPVTEARAKQLFDALWPDLEKKLSAIPKNVSPAKHARPQPEILEELVAGVRSLESRFRDSDDAHPMRRRRRIHPGMMMEMLEAHFPKSDPMRLLLLSSLVRDDAPWLYELGVDAYRRAVAVEDMDGDLVAREAAEDALARFRRAVEMFRRGPFPLEEFGGDPRLLSLLAHELNRVVDPKPTSPPVLQPPEVLAEAVKPSDGVQKQNGNRAPVSARRLSDRKRP